MSDDKPLPPDLQALLEAERNAPGAPAASRDRVRAKLAISIGAAAVGAAGAASATPALGATAIKAAPTVAGKLLLAKIGLAVVAVVGVGVGVGVAVRSKPRPAIANANVNVNVNVNANANANVNANANAPVVAGLRAGPNANADTPPARAVKSTSPARHREAPATSDLTAERALVDDARQSLSAGDAPAALAALGRHAARYPAGQLAEERDGLLVRALATAGRATEARAQADGFRRAHPHSIFLPVVDATVRALPSP